MDRDVVLKEKDEVRTHVGKEQNRKQCSERQDQRVRRDFCREVVFRVGFE
jgi:hypothetical protein